MQEYFSRLADCAVAALTGREHLLCSFMAEDSDFVRFNRSAVRQAGSVVQRDLELKLIDGPRQAAGDLTLCGDFDVDRTRVASLLDRLRSRIPQLPEDPYLSYATDVRSSEQRGRNRLPEERGAIVEAVLDAGRGRDLVGVYAAGGMHAGFANSFGQRNWFSSHTYHVDWSFYAAGDRAVKTTHAGFVWDPPAFQRTVDTAAHQLAVLGRPVKTIAPGRYRVYLAPAAVADIVEMLNWGGFSLKQQRTAHTPLIRMVQEDARLHPGVTFVENTRDGVAPDFQEDGFRKPARVCLLDRGRLADPLVSPRSAREYGVETNGASRWEDAESIDMAPGDLDRADVLARLGTGLYVNNVWYLNFSDRAACRLTGMTRFATFWVEDGEIQAPLSAMRFDESLYRLLGTNLIGLTAQRDYIFDSDTYHGRSTGSRRLPGLLVEDFTLTL